VTRAHLQRAFRSPYTPAVLGLNTAATTFPHYIYGPGGQVLEQISGTSALFYHHDQIGSVRATTNSSGTLQSSYAYDPYGTSGTACGSSQPFRFSGEYCDTESGFYYLRARYYDPGTGQFLTRDPLVMLTRSAYSYVAGNPLNLSDPSGLGGEDACGADNPTNLDPICGIEDLAQLIVDGILGSPSSQTLANILGNLDPRTFEGMIGDGTTTQAIIYERETGLLVQGKNHIEKGWQTVRALEKWMQANPDACFSDMVAAEETAAMLLEALTDPRFGPFVGPRLP
jgi:RHS repeat-associated protein